MKTFDNILKRIMSMMKAHLEYSQNLALEFSDLIKDYEELNEVPENIVVEAVCDEFEELVENGHDPKAVEQSRNKELVVSQSIRIKNRKSNRNKNIHSTKKKLQLKISRKRSCDKNTQDIHTGQKPFECSICNMRFRLKWILGRHTRIHTSEKPFKCLICNKKFVCKSDLDRHTRIHTGEKPFECSICNKRFLQKCNLDSHTRIHTGEKPFECSICNKRFGNKSDLERHIRVHTGEKPFECLTCSKGFNMKSHLDRHNRIHTGEKPFECSFCNKRFGHKIQLNRHSIIHKEVK